MRYNKPLILTSILLCLGGCNTTEDVVPTQVPPIKEKYFQEVTSTENDPFPSVGAIVTKDGILIGSGVLIKSNVVLTAAHVIDDDLPYYFSILDELIEIDKKIIHPNYEYLGSKVSGDIGIVILKEDSIIKPVELANKDDVMFKGQPIFTVGYGRGYKKYSLPNTFWYYGTLTTELDQFKVLPLKDTIWFGDSGGAVFAFVDDELKIIGIISSLSIKDGVVYENSSTSVRYYRDWIDKYDR